MVDTWDFLNLLQVNRIHTQLLLLQPLYCNESIYYFVFALFTDLLQ